MNNYKLLNFDVLVIGGGASGTAAGIQAARLGASTLIIEETQWLGGMITSAGVSAFDGNKYGLGGGIFGELRKLLEDYYGGPEKTFTGWISLTCFEPKIGMKFLHQLADSEKNLTTWFETSVEKILKKENKILGAIVKQKNGAQFEIHSKVIIEATEFGDVLKLADVPYRLGRDSKDDTNEPNAPYKADGIVQDITYCAILKKYENAAPLIAKPKNYNPEIFINSTSIDFNTTDEDVLNHKLHSWESFISYAALPNNKYLLNWPFHSNDYPTSLDIYENLSNRIYHYKKAKEHTLSYIYYIQTKLGHPEWGLALDEFPTNDFLPLIPYVREGRRGKGIYLMVEQDVVPNINSFRPTLRNDSIAVGDYFLDHHHSHFHLPKGKRLIEELPGNAPFQIPFGSLIPKDVEGLILAEKSISVSHIVNGCTRLQPVVMLIGQAAGVIAALSITENGDAVNVPITKVQEELLNSGCQLFPYHDVWNSHPAFIPIQKLALKGIFIDEKDYSFNPNFIVSEEEAAMLLSNINVDQTIKNSLIKNLVGQKRSTAFEIIYQSKITL
jgi:hypothetical protein